ncbi:hypothetical protein M9H77_22879 [Catharanthus roseus]|uniref:Uncharacterized protein n=1 Tax=Catharanthus roseus TaxID=4058 RepID=A0ACC0AVQ6_CATRO|nr:hypothetical protein M9H77_22879 [Catharanthus roseus]
MGLEQIDFNIITYGQLFAFIKQEALSACQELKFQAKYGCERRELGSFCEAFGITGIKTSSAHLKRQQRSFRNTPRYSRRRYSRRFKPSPPEFYTPPRKSHYKKPKFNKIICYKCGQPGHKADVCRSKKINEILDQFPDLDKELKEKLTISLVQDDSSFEHQPDDFQEFSRADDDNISSPCACKVINMIKHSSDNTVKDQKELIFDIIQDLPPEAQKRQLEKLRTLILGEESSSARLIEPFSISKMFDRYPNLNPPIRQHNTTELQTEIRSLKAQVKELKECVFSVETKNLELDTQIALLQSRTSKGNEILPDSSIPDFPFTEIPMPVFNNYLKVQVLQKSQFKQLLQSKPLRLPLHPNQNPHIPRLQLMMPTMQLNFKNSYASKHFNNNSNSKRLIVRRPHRVPLLSLSCRTPEKCSFHLYVLVRCWSAHKPVGKPVGKGCSRQSGPIQINPLVSLLGIGIANLMRRMFSSGSSLDSHIIQSKEEQISYNFNDWTIPEEQIETIYKVGTFDFKTAFSVKTHEETMNIQEKFQTIPLLSKVSLQKYAEKCFRYIHYGLIQVAVKPLVHLGVDAPIYLALRDKRLKRYKSSLLAMIQTNICNGPIYFNCAPNYSVSLTDPLIMNSLVLDEFEKLTEQFVVMYRIYYRLLSSQLNPRFKLIPTSRDETVLLHIEAEQ